jgi:hypothetical protein
MSNPMNTFVHAKHHEHMFTCQPYFDIQSVEVKKTYNPGHGFHTPYVVVSFVFNDLR